LLGLLQGRAVLALTDTAATIKTASGGTVIYRKHGKPAGSADAGTICC
jgi:hypothetical protein